MDETIPQLEAPLSANPPVHPSDVKRPMSRLQDLKLRLTRAAMCHQYAQIEYDRTLCVVRRGELLDEMALYHKDYRDVRINIAHFHPEILEELELDLRAQKQLVFTGHQS